MNAIDLYRIARWSHQRGIPVIPRLMHYLTFLVYNSVIPPTAEIGEGTTLGYGGMGVVIHPRCRIGRNVMIAQQVSIGGRSQMHGVPVIEDNCFIGPGSKILGPIRIGECSVVGANAVVIDDIPPRSVAAGVPARIIRSEIRIQDYYSVRAS